MHTLIWTESMRQLNRVSGSRGRRDKLRVLVSSLYLDCCLCHLVAANAESAGPFALWQWHPLKGETSIPTDYRAVSFLKL